MAKGGSFERAVCKSLSLWWTVGAVDDVFWRSSQSGGRATSRFKNGKGTRGHCGDICSTDHLGIPLTSFITFELKRGYHKANLSQVIDRPRQDVNCQLEFEGFVEQAWLASRRAGTPHWCLVHKRDRQEAMMYFPFKLFTDLHDLGCRFAKPIVTLMAEFKMEDKSWKYFNVAGVRYDHFLAAVDPQDVKTLSQSRERNKRRQ